MKTKLTLILCFFILHSSFLLSARAQGTAFTYQGRLNSGSSPANGSYDVAFTLFNTNITGAPIAGPVTNSATLVSNGLFTATIDFGPGVFTGDSNWLEIAVSTNGAGSFTTLAPRQQLTPTPYAIFAGGANAAGLTGTIAASNIANGTITANLLAVGAVGTNQLATNIGVWSQSGSNLFYNNGNVGIGTNTPVASLWVQGDGAANSGTIVGVQATGSPGSAGLFGRSLVPGGNGVYGRSDVLLTNVSGPGAGNIGVYGVSTATNGSAVLGWASAGSGQTFGVVGEVSSPQGYAGYFQGRGYFSGNVGIGTTTPASTLEVNGTAKATAFSGDGSGLTGLNASQLAGGTVPDAQLSANVALLNRTPQTFTGANTFDRGSGGPGRLIVTGNSPVDTTAFTGLGFQYNTGPGEGAIMSSFNDGFGYLSFYTKPMFGQPITKQMIISQWGDVAVDQANANNGALNNGTVNGAGLSFGSGSGEGIASKRTAGGNQFGLDFYTAFTARLSIANGGNVGIGTTTPSAKLEVAGTPGTDGIKFPDNTVQLTAPKPVFISGYGNDPWNTNRFLSPSVVVTVTSSSQQVLVTGNKALGSIPGAQFLNLYIGYRVSGSVAAPFTVGGGSFGQKVPANTRVIMGLSGVITGLAPGNYEVGLVGYSTDYANWNSNEYGYTTATVY